MVGNATWSMMFHNTEGYNPDKYYNPAINCLSNPPTTTEHDYTGPGSTLKMISNAMQGATSSKKMIFPSCPKLPGNHDAIYGFRFDSPTSEQAIIMNLSSVQKTIVLATNDWNLTNAKYEQFTPGQGGVLDFLTGSAN